MNRIHIVAAIIYNDKKSEVFITKRADHLHKGGFWEFPGGKVEQGENIQQAIARELFEEVGIEVTMLTHFHQLDFDYSDKSLKFDFFTVEAFNHSPFGKEGQRGEWVEIDKLKNYAFPEANLPILDMLD